MQWSYTGLWHGRKSFKNFRKIISAFSYNLFTLVIVTLRRSQGIWKVLLKKKFLWNQDIPWTNLLCLTSHSPLLSPPRMFRAVPPAQALLCYLYPWGTGLQVLKITQTQEAPRWFLEGYSQPKQWLWRDGTSSTVSAVTTLLSTAANYCSQSQVLFLFFHQQYHHLQFSYFSGLFQRFTKFFSL